MTSELSANLSNYSEQVEKMSLMVTKPSRSLYCKNTRRIVKRFKKKNGLASDSIVERETWSKIMQKAKDLLPIRLREKAVI